MLALEAVAPVTAVRGNTDHSGLAASLPDSETLTVGDVRILVRHVPFRSLGRDGEGFDILVNGHTHRASVRTAGALLVVDPGSASRPRGGEPASIALLEIEDDQVKAEIVHL